MDNKIRVGINGFGRIGRTLTRVIEERNDIELVAINDLADVTTLAHLLKYDSIHRKFPNDVRVEDGGIVIGDKRVKLYNKANPNEIPWSDANVDIVIECTGKFLTRDLAVGHLVGGAKKVILSAPPKSDDIQSVVLGINDEVLSDDVIISNASCTTNCAAPMVKIIDDMYGIDQAYITTVHSYTSDQRLHDAPHKDLRRARSAPNSIVPTTTGAAKAITKIFPHLEGKMGGCGIRVPVPNGSLTDITFVVNNRPMSVEDVNTAFKKASEVTLKGILGYTEEPLVSIDIVGTHESCIFDAQLTSVLGNMVKIVGWYDNEMGYSNRLADLIEKIR